MSSFTNVKDAVYNNLYLINDEGGLDNIRDLLSVAGGDVSDILAEINKKAPKQNPEFTGTMTVPDGTLSIDDVLTLRATLESKAPIENPTLTGIVLYQEQLFRQNLVVQYSINQ